MSKSESSWRGFQYFSVFIVLFSIGAIYIAHNVETMLLLTDFVRSFDNCTQYNRNENFFLSGNFHPVDKEYTNIKLTTIEGDLPSQFDGVFLRVGPNPISHHDSRRYHWFDGHGMIHSVRVLNGSIYYSNKWLETPRYKLERSLDRPIFLQIGEIKGFIGIVMAALISPQLTALMGLDQFTVGTANTNIVYHQGRIFACQEQSLPFEIEWTKDNHLRSVGYESWGSSNTFPLTAHAKIDNLHDRIYFNSYSVMNSTAEMSVGVVTPTGRLETHMPLKVGSQAWAHDQALTENYIIILQPSVVFDKKGMYQGRLFNYSPENNLRIGVLPKGNVTQEGILWFTWNEPLAVVHTLNAWESLDSSGNTLIHLWMPTSSSFNGLLTGDIDPFFMTEIMLDLGTERMTLNVIDRERTVEFPRVHPAFDGKFSKYGYAMRYRKNSVFFESIVKYNLVSKDVEGEIPLGEGIIAGEAVPIPFDDKSSDSIYLALFVHDSRNGSSGAEWRVYDGSTMNEVPLTRVLLPRDIRVPFGFHGQWIPERDLQEHFKTKKGGEKVR
jgi:carotenoid 9,10(9',10')-cleavage dioxygenase 1